MRLKLILLVSTLMFGSLSYAQRGARIGYIDMEYILENVLALHSLNEILINSILTYIILSLRLQEKVFTKLIINLKIFSPNISLILKLIHGQNFEIGRS